MGEKKKGSWLKEKAVPRRKQVKSNGTQQLETSKYDSQKQQDLAMSSKTPTDVETCDDCSKGCGE